MRRTSLLLAIVVLSLSAGHCQAQFFFPAFQRYTPQGTYHPSDNAPFSHRYNYGAPIAYFGCGGQNMLAEEYLDRIDRAEKFGYQLPPPPNFGNPCCCQPSMGVGMGFFQRIR